MGDRRTDGARIGGVVNNVASLFQTRLRQAQREGKAFARALVAGTILLVVALVLIVLAVPLAVVTVILLLTEVMPAWAAVAIVLGGMLLAGAVLLLLARRALRLKRFQVVADLREDVAAIRRLLRISSSTPEQPPVSTP